VEGEWSIGGHLDLISGVRYDKHSDFEGIVNSGTVLIWCASNTVTPKFICDSAFRTPSLGELGLQNALGVLGNKNLAPETVDSYELVFNFRPQASLHTDFNLVFYRAKDLIELVPSWVGTQAEDARDQESYGFEGDANWSLNQHVRFNTNVSWQ